MLETALEACGFIVEDLIVVVKEIRSQFSIPEEISFRHILNILIKNN